MGLKSASRLPKSREHLKWRNRAALMIVVFAGVVGGSTYLLNSQDIDPVQFYANMANPSMRFVRIQPGLRKEQMADIYGKTLAWNDQNKEAFLSAAGAAKDVSTDVDGYYLPGSYWFDKNAGGAEVGSEMIEKFNNTINKEVIKKKTSNLKKNVNIDTAVRIASIIQREAAGKEDMRLISGVIWNRMFKGMNLQMDATLQYVKGTSTDWWPQVKSEDKALESPFNTYKYKGLPPTAIANPSVAAIEAAYNPINTSCLFYIHDNNRQIHCTSSYEVHKQNIQRYLVGKR
ncbi:MAG: endolytic transglycosylase MltG [Patescibacteria group bacterium]